MAYLFTRGYSNVHFTEATDDDSSVYMLCHDHCFLGKDTIPIVKMCTKIVE